jgi:hypothetical protein
MSFSFRNIFSPDDSEFEAASDPTVPSGFSAPGGIPLGRGNLSGEAPASGPAQSFLASELLPYIPKAIAAQSGIPMAKEVMVPVPADGSLDVRLSTLYQICPELFAAEITPLNDSVVTLPPRLGATPAAPAAATGPVLTKPSLTGAGASETPANPFWSPVTTGSSPKAAASPASSAPAVDKPAASDPAFSWSVPSPAKENPFSSEPVATGNAFSAPAKPSVPEVPKFAGGFDSPATLEAGGGFGSASGVSAPDPSPGFSEAAPAKVDGGKADGRPRTNPFESNQGFATLFSKQADADAGIPFPDSAVVPAAGGASKSSEPEGVWGAMFSGSGFVEAEEEVAESGAAPFESIGNLLKLGKSSTAEAEPANSAAPADNAFGGFVSGVKTPPALPKSDPSPEFAFAAGFSAFAPASAEEPTKEAAAAESPRPPFAGFADPLAEPVSPAPSMNPASSAFAPFQNPPAPPVIDAPTTSVIEPSYGSALEVPAVPVSETPAQADSFALPQGAGTPASELEVAPEPAPVAENGAEEESCVPLPAFTSLTPSRELPVAPPAAEVVEPAPVPTVPEIREEAVAEEVLPVLEEDAPVVEHHAEPTPIAPTAPQAVAPVATVVPVATTAPSPAAAPDDELRDLELRAIFSTSEVFTFSKVARKVVGLPGINSCSLSAPGKLVQASRREENRLGNEARDMVATLRSLAKLTGLPEARTFTLQTDRGIVSLFLEGDCCVTVHHDSTAFQPGVREKLILVARSLVKLRE